MIKFGFGWDAVDQHILNELKNGPASLSNVVKNVINNGIEAKHVFIRINRLREKGVLSYDVDTRLITLL